MKKDDSGLSAGGCAMVFLAVVMTVLLLLILAGCSPKVIEPIAHKRDTTYVEHTQIDSIYRRDSIFVKERGDTVYIYKERIRDQYKLFRDTVTVVRIDSVAYEALKEVKVIQPISTWKQVKIRAFWPLLLALAAALIWIFRRPILRLIGIIK